MKSEATKLLAKSMTVALADTLSASIFLRTAHWNVEGSAFFPLHAFYGAQYEKFDEDADELAERILTLGSYAKPDLKLRAPSNGDPEAVLAVIQGNRDLLEAVCEAASAADDDVTENMILGWLEARDKALWMLKAHTVG